MNLSLRAKSALALLLCLSVQNSQCENLPAPMQFSISIGVVEHDWDNQFSETLKRADHALYEAKREGRNCIAFAP